MYPSMACKCVDCVCALLEEWISVSFFLLHPSHIQCFPPSHSPSLSFLLCLRLPPILCSLPPFLPPFLPLPRLQCKYSSLPCWTCDEKVTGSRAPPHLLFHHQRSISPLHCALAVSSSLPLSLSLLFLSLFRLLPSFCSSHTQGGDLSSARGKKRKKVCCYFYSQGLPTARPSIDGAFFSLTTSWILTLCLQLAAQQLCKTWQQVAFRGLFALLAH